jgi:hypothetical protein
MLTFTRPLGHVSQQIAFLNPAGGGRGKSFPLTLVQNSCTILLGQGSEPPTCLHHGLIINAPRAESLGFVPQLAVSNDEIAKMLELMTLATEEFMSGRSLA